MTLQIHKPGYNFVKIPESAVTVLYIMFKIVIYPEITFDIDSNSFI